MRSNGRSVLGPFIGPAAVALAFGLLGSSAIAAPIALSSTEADTGSVGASSIVLTLPGSVASGQLLLSELTIEGSGAASATISLPSGWLEIRHDSCGTDLLTSLAYRFAQTGDAPATQFTWSFNGTFAAAGSIISFSGVNSLAPIDAESFACATASQTVTAPSVTSVEGSSLDLLLFGTDQGDMLSQPAGYSAMYEHAVPDIGPMIGADISSIATGGTPTGDQTVTADATTDNVGYQLLLAPVPTPDADADCAHYASTCSGPYPDSDADSDFDPDGNTEPDGNDQPRLLRQYRPRRRRRPQYRSLWWAPRPATTPPTAIRARSASEFRTVQPSATSRSPGSMS